MIGNAQTTRRQISVTLPRPILEHLDSAAAAERRSRSNMLSALLARIFEESPQRAPADATAEARHV